MKINSLAPLVAALLVAAAPSAADKADYDGSTLRNGRGLGSSGSASGSGHGRGRKSAGNLLPGNNGMCDLTGHYRSAVPFKQPIGIGNLTALGDTQEIQFICFDNEADFCEVLDFLDPALPGVFTTFESLCVPPSPTPAPESKSNSKSSDDDDRVLQRCIVRTSPSFLKADASNFDDQINPPLGFVEVFLVPNPEFENGDDLFCIFESIIGVSNIIKGETPLTPLLDPLAFGVDLFGSVAREDILIIERGCNDRGDTNTTSRLLEEENSDAADINPRFSLHRRLTGKEKDCPDKGDRRRLQVETTGSMLFFKTSTN